MSLSDTSTYSTYITSALMTIISMSPSNSFPLQRSEADGSSMYICEQNISQSSTLLPINSNISSYSFLVNNRILTVADKPNANEEESRYELIIRSFGNYSDEFPKEKERYLLFLADSLCKLQFKDNVSYYDSSFETIETILELKNGLTLRISQFTNEELESSAVFSIHCGTELLVANEMPISKIVDKINTVSRNS